jgi:amylosucrase
LFFKPKGKRPEAWQEFSARLEQHFPRLFGLLVGLYGTQYDFFYYWKKLCSAWLKRGWSALRT